MNHFEEPELEILRFGNTDVIATSTPLDNTPIESNQGIITPEVPIEFNVNA